MQKLCTVYFINESIFLAKFTLKKEPASGGSEAFLADRAYSHGKSNPGARACHAHSKMGCLIKMNED